MKLEFFEPTMCCSTGICGPSVDERLVRISENIEYLKKNYKGISIHRYQPQQSPIVFMTNKGVRDLMKEVGKKALPITVYNGKVIKQGEYPTLEELEKAIRGE